MYWPHGVPQIYSQQSGQDEASVKHDDDWNVSNGTSETKGQIPPDERGHWEDEGRSDVMAGRELPNEGIIDLKVARADHFFATITETSLSVWSLRPTVVLTSLIRSSKSLTNYGKNLAVLFRPDASTVVLRTTLGFLLAYALETDTTTRILQQRTDLSQSRKQGILRTFGTSDTYGLEEVALRFRKAIKIDAGINAVLALDQDLIIATNKPAAIQCIKWESPRGNPQASAQLVSKMDWVEDRTAISFMTHDRAMNLFVWLTDAGAAYAVRRPRPSLTKSVSSEDNLQPLSTSTTSPIRIFEGYCFHRPENHGAKAIRTAVNARFSLIAVALENGNLLCYAAKDYTGNVPLSHSFPNAASTSQFGSLTCLSWSPDGFCLFAGYERGWASWSVFGKPGSSSFTSNSSHAEANDERWLQGVKCARWISSGAELLLTCFDDKRIWKLDFSRSAAVGCLSCANLVRGLLQMPSELAIYRGHESPDLSSISNEASLWHHAQFPAAYLHTQWPIKSCVVSQDGRYIAIAGRRGLAHYSVQSGRWRVFSDYQAENSFAVRGGMCWFNHILIVAAEHANGYDLRMYSRDHELGPSFLHAEPFSLPIAYLGTSGEDSLLVYTYENILYHYILDVNARSAQLMQVGQIAFHGLVRAPSRVRSVSWILPEHQLRNGDPSRDVEHAAVLFLVDDKLVLLQPMRAPESAVKYDMRVIAQCVEYYILMRDQISFNFSETVGDSAPPTPSPSFAFGGKRPQPHYSLRDSLWILSAAELRMWPEVHDILQSVSKEMAQKVPSLTIPVDFYPLSILLNKGVVLGIESELLQRRDVNFAQSRTLLRTQLFLPYVVRNQLLDVTNTPAAFALANQYQNLSYFPHALEILLHHVLDDESDRKKKANVDTGQPEPIPSVLSFLQVVLSPKSYLSTIVQCIRKTEISFWKHLLAHLPPPHTLFEQALALNDLKTASGYLLVLQSLEDEEAYENNSADEAVQERAEGAQTMSEHEFEDHVVRLMRLAKEANDFELCSELARFMIGIDPRGDALRRVIQQVDFQDRRSGPAQGAVQHHKPKTGAGGRSDVRKLGLQIPENKAGSRSSSAKADGTRSGNRLTQLLAEEPRSAGTESEDVLSQGSTGTGDYFSASPRGL